MFDIDPKYEMACYLWATYYYKTEEYDRMVCGARSRYGTAIPVGDVQHRLIREHAKECRKRMLEQSKVHKIDKRTLKEAGREMVQLSHTQYGEQIKEYERRWQRENQTDGSARPRTTLRGTPAAKKGGDEDG